MTRWTVPRLVQLAPGAALAAAAVVVALEAPGLERVLNATLAGVGVLLLWGVAAAVRARYPDRFLGTLLFAVAAAYAVQTMTSSPHAGLFTLARAVRPAVEVLLIWAMLAFPSGRIERRSDKALVVISALIVMLLWLPGMTLSSSIPMAGPFVSCSQDCPANVLFIAERPDLSQLLLQGFRIIGSLILMAVALLLLDRLRRATPLKRRMLAPVLVASIARALNVAVFLATGIGGLMLTFTFWLVPLSIGFGLLRGRLYTARALQRLVTGLRNRPPRQEMRAVMAQALDDPSLTLAYWSTQNQRWIGADGQAVVLPVHQTGGRAVKIVADPQGRPLAALVHDEALLEEPSLLNAVADSMKYALESQRIEADLLESQAHTAVAVEDERRRIERDLHDGAQQRLIALRMKIGVTGRLLDDDPRRAAALLRELDSDVETALVELRTLAHGIVPALLTERGLSTALRDAAQQAGIPVHIEIAEVGRADPLVERAVYFCCLEALQNAAKHAGPNAQARLSLDSDRDELRFSVSDTGAGASPIEGLRKGQGMMNMQDRILSVGGDVEFECRSGVGFCVSGRVGRTANRRPPL
ncbi:MAG TPA: histidine kinase [Aquabacterium sp.]|jgi:signal transduction histidine kinase|nr:histidine kinase [Aquabacterium sp.]HQC96479.1 histidine kinase [Aquabacterium sp.]